MPKAAVGDKAKGKRPMAQWDGKALASHDAPERPNKVGAGDWERAPTDDAYDADAGADPDHDSDDA